MLVVDSSVWIDFFNAADNSSVDVLEQLLGHGEVRLVVPDLVLFEVLRGYSPSARSPAGAPADGDIEHRSRRRRRTGADGGRALPEPPRAWLTVRSSIDVLVATFCIERDYALLHRDRDFDAFEDLRGLRGWRY